MIADIAENRLTSVTLPGSGGTVTFKYDPFGRRIQKSGPAGTTIYLYDGANVVDEVNSAGAVTAQYAQGAGVDEPLAATLGGTLAFYEADGLGSVTSLTDSSGSAVGAYIRDSFGKAVSTADTLGNRFRYTGREWDEETGLYYYRARYYDPTIGRFISEDSLQFAAGTNFYSYLENSPVSHRDPTGHWGGVDDLTAMGAGALVGVGRQAVADIVSGKIGTLGDYVGSATGGAITGEVILYTGNPVLAGAAGGAIGNLTSQGINNIAGDQSGLNVGGLVANTAFGGYSGYLGITGSNAENLIVGGIAKALSGHWLPNPQTTPPRCKSNSQPVMPPPKAWVPDVTPCNPGFCVNQPNYGLPPGGYHTGG